MQTTTAQQIIRVMMADDQDLLRSGLAMFIDSCDHLKLVGEAANGAEAAALYDELRPDVVLMDLMMPHMDGLAAIRAIRSTHPDARIIVLTSFDDERLVQAAIQAGVMSYLLKNVAPGELAAAIQDAYDGKSTLSREAAQALVNATQRPNAASYKLTRREQEVLGLMIRGLNNTEIAHAMTVSRSTVKKHVSNILGKLDTASRTEAVALAVQHRLVHS